MAVMAFILKTPHPRPHVAPGPCIEKLSFQEVLERGKAPRHRPSAGEAMPGVGEVVEAGTQELENSIASHSALSLLPPCLSLSQSLILPGEKPPYTHKASNTASL